VWRVLENERETDKTGQRGSWWLVSVEGMVRTMRLPVGGPLLVGRGAYNHIVLDDSRVSRQHARVAPEPDGYVVYDLKSRNGTLVNGTAVTRHVLAHDDLIGFGPFVFRLEYRPAEELVRPLVRSFEKPTLDGLGNLLRDRPSAHERVSRMENLGTLYSFTETISKASGRRALLQRVGAAILEVFPAARYVGLHLRSGTEKGRDEGLHIAHCVGVARPLSEDVRRAVLGRAEAVLTSPSMSRASGGMEMIAPLLDRDEVLGVVHVGADEQSGSFSHADLDLLEDLASRAAIVLHNSRLHEESLVQVRLRQDLALAAQIQTSFLPREVLAVQGLDLFAEYRAAYTVGGDFYDVFWVGPHRLGVVIGDISGKGISGALLMARISGELRSAALTHVDPVAVLTAMNEATLLRGQTELFFTAIYLTMDVTTGEILLANAGHPTPYARRANGAIEPITAGRACAVGILEDPHFAVTKLRLDHGDSLILYTDGVVEAASGDGKLYGEERLEACLATTGSLPKEIAEHILRSVDQHAAEGPVNDDLTLFICQRSVGTEATMQPRNRASSFPAPVVARGDGLNTT